MAASGKILSTVPDDNHKYSRAAEGSETSIGADEKRVESREKKKVNKVRLISKLVPRM